MDRLFPEISFFSEQIDLSQREDDPIMTPLLESMKRILFIWSKENEKISYRQGMHELLACFIYQFYRDIYLDNFQNYLKNFVKTRDEKKLPTSLSNLNEKSLNMEEKISLDELKQHLNPYYIEHDCYIFFNRLMMKMKNFFEWNQNHESRKKAEDFPLHIFCDQIQNQILKKGDPILYNRLSSLNIEPQIYGLRWVRLLFGREFQLDDVLNLWDAIFSHGFKGMIGFESNAEQMNHSPEDLIFVQYISVVMLIYLREDLLKSQPTDCLKYLMKFPSVDNPHIFIEKALKYMDKPTFSKLFNEKSIKKKEEISTPVMVGIQNIPTHQKQKSSITKEIGNIASGFVSPKPKSKNAPTQERDKKLVNVLDEIVLILQQEVFKPTVEVNDIDAVTLSIAELKRISHVLQGEASLHSLDDAFTWIENYKKNKNKESTSSSVTSSTITKKKFRPIGAI